MVKATASLCFTSSHPSQSQYLKQPPSSSLRTSPDAAKMQNRTNRGLLFGPRSTAGADPKASADAETMESDNQIAIDQLRGSAGTIKDIAIHIDSSVNDQNRMLDRMDKRFDGANSLIGNTLNALNEMVNDRTSSRMCAFVGAFFVALLLLYHLIKKN